MIQQETCLKVADNTGARQLICIRMLGGSSRANIGDIIISVVKASLSNVTVPRSELVRALVVRTCQSIQRVNGS